MFYSNLGAQELILNTKVFLFLISPLGKTINTALTTRQYEITQYEGEDPIMWGYSNLKNKTGTYNWVVCDQELFESKFKVSDKHNYLKYPSFCKAKGKIKYRKLDIVMPDKLNESDKEMLPDEEDEKIDLYEVMCDEWDGYLGAYYPYDDAVECELFEIHSSGICFNPDKDQYKTPEERQDWINYGKRFNFEYQEKFMPPYLNHDDETRELWKNANPGQVVPWPKPEEE